MIKKGEKRCPFCGGRLQPRGHVKRKLRLGDGETTVIKLRRYSCSECGKWHREFPNDITPYKQYSEPIIRKFMSGELDDSHIGFESFPVDITKKRWKTRK